MPKAEICENGIDEDCNGSDLPCVRTLDISIIGSANLSTTNQSTPVITGTVEQTATEVTCNGRPAGINANGFGENVPLKEDSHIITCVAKDAEGNLGSASITVSLDSTPPRVTIDSPEDNAVVTSSPISVTGLVNDLVMGTVNGDEAGVRCNGVEAQVANRRFVAEVTLTAGENTVTCIGEDKVGNIDSAHITVTLDTAAQNTIKVTSGNNQTGEIGALLSQPLVVTLTENGNPAVNKVVVFKVLQNDGVLSTTTNTQTARTANSVANAVATDTDEGRILAVNTDTNSRTSIQFKLGSWAGAGNNQVEATATDFIGAARFTASASAGEANSIVVDSGNNQIGATGSYLLPLAYPEGCPTHPSYPAGHAAIAEACVTVLKAFFNESFVLPQPVVASADGLSLLPYKGTALTAGGELNKLATNIALGRDTAGVPWRSDSIAGLALGEAVAVGILRDLRATYSESFGGFKFTAFDGSTLVV